MTVARQFTILAVVPFLLVMGFAAILTLQIANLSGESASLVGSLQQTAALSQELARGNNELLATLQRHLTQPDDALIERSRSLAYELGRKYTDYLKLDIGDRERLTVERARSLQSESVLLSMQIYEELRSGARAGVESRVLRLYEKQDLIRGEFETLSSLQVEKLRDALGRLNVSAREGFVAVIVLVCAMVGASAASAFLLRRRILRPVRALLAASERVRQGDFSARAPGAQSDEFGQLTSGFNFMAESLAESYASLEGKVEERTRQLREAQGQLIRAEKMSALGLLVSGVAHELNNPLGAVRGFVELARMDVAAAGGSPNVIGLLDDADAQIERCRRITGDLLQFARHRVPRLEPVDANAALDQVVRLREYELETHNTRVLREFDPSNPAVSADPDRLQQVLLNLLNNAHDAVRDNAAGGQVAVRTRRDGPYVLFEFLDNGPGFRDVDRAFDPFYTTKDVGQGTGLGLSICHGIVRDHHGEITVTNLNPGAQVIVRLPAAEAAAESPSPVDTIPPPASRPDQQPVVVTRALVVDDEPMLARLQVAFLKRMGIEAESAATGEEAIGYLNGNRVDLIVSDVRMPGLVDGVQLFDWVRETHPRLIRRFLFASGDVAGLSGRDFFRRHQVPTIAKPFRFEEYELIVRRILDASEAEP